MTDATLLERLYASVLWIRMVEEAIVQEYPKQEIKTPTHFHIGQEAIPGGVCEALEKSDKVFAYYRSHGWYLAKGGNLQRMMDELYGRATGCSRGFGGSMHLIDLDAGFAGTTAVVAGAMPHAAGAAFTFKVRGTGRVVVSCFGDGATEEGLFQETVMFSVLRKLPVVFVCENNGLATNTWIRDRQPPIPIHQRAAAMGIASAHVDGNDAVAVHQATVRAVERARAGEGPSFIECATYRMLEHCGPNNDVQLGYRTMDEINEWKKADPVLRLERQVPLEVQRRLRGRYESEIREAFERAKKAPYPTALVPEGMPCH